MLLFELFDIFISQGIFFPHNNLISKESINLYLLFYLYMIIHHHKFGLSIMLQTKKKTQNILLDFENIYKCGNAKVKILKPAWL